MKINLLLIFLTFFSPVFAQEEKPQSKSEKVESVESDELDEIRRKRFEPRISRKYYRGEHLIYDCKSNHFACVNRESFNLCKENREFDIVERRRNLRCAPLKVFRTQKECFDEQYKQIHNQKIKIICINKKNL
ncbi:MAG: hypothetical protein GY909_08530 [Oligoflexia bacterium]|nr:hypothetical protein [Oligoflexia bacterium]